MLEGLFAILELLFWLGLLVSGLEESPSGKSARRPEITARPTPPGRTFHGDSAGHVN